MAAVAAIGRDARPASLALVADAPDGLPAQAPAGVATAHGERGAALLRAADVVVRSPGISRYRADVRALADAGVRLTTATNLWMASHPEATVVAVTGTKGKSTASSLLWTILAQAGVPALLGGNVGRPLLDLEAAPGDVVVAELSSYQLADLERAPDVAVVLNVFPEHLDWHGGMDAYVRDKLRAVTLSDETHAVLNAEDERLRALGAGRPRVTWFGAPDGLHARPDGVWDGDALVLAASDVPLAGRHNLANVAAALAAARLLGVAPAAAADAVRGFSALPHRLETVATDARGRTWVDDSISTTPESTLAALSVFADRPLAVLLGGTDRGQDHAALAAALVGRAAPTAALLCPDTGARIAPALGAPVDARSVAGLDEAIALADRLAPDGAVVLLSPAAASFPAFRSFEERGERFAAAARRLAG
jgi:UDP-N-acetylmuramoylalanine--D-glutamate ligase